MGIGRIVSNNPESTEEAPTVSLSDEPPLEAGFSALDEKLDLKDLEKCVEAASRLSVSGTSTRCTAVLISMGMQVVTAGTPENAPLEAEFPRYVRSGSGCWGTSSCCMHQ
jgi:hypothetical protein